MKYILSHGTEKECNIYTIIESASRGNIINIPIGYECSYNDGKIVSIPVLKTIPADASISIPDISDSVSQNGTYTLPSIATAVMNDGNLVNVNVIWDKQIDTSTSGTFVYTGTVDGYSGKVNLTLDIGDTMPTGDIIMEP